MTASQTENFFSTGYSRNSCAGDFQYDALTKRSNERIQLVCSTCQLNAKHAVRQVHDLTAKNIRSALHFGTLRPRGLNLDKHQLAFYVSTFCEIDELDDIDQFVQMSRSSPLVVIVRRESD